MIFKNCAFYFIKSKHCCTYRVKFIVFVDINEKVVIKIIMLKSRTFSVLTSPVKKEKCISKAHLKVRTKVKVKTISQDIKK